MCVRATTLLRACYNVVACMLQTWEASLNFQPGLGVLIIRSRKNDRDCSLVDLFERNDPGGGKPSQGPVFGEAVNTQLGQ